MLCNVMSQVDSVLLSHPFVAEAVSFGAPDEKYGEVVAAAVVLTGNAPKDHKQVRFQAQLRTDMMKICALDVTFASFQRTKAKVRYFCTELRSPCRRRA